jgi:hypothetical protein
VAIPTDRNVVQKGGGKKLKYTNLCMEICRMWNRKCMVIPVITGATKMAAKVYRKI